MLIIEECSFLFTVCLLSAVWYINTQFLSLLISCRVGHFPYEEPEVRDHNLFLVIQLVTHIILFDIFKYLHIQPLRSLFHIILEELL